MNPAATPGPPDGPLGAGVDGAARVVARILEGTAGVERDSTPDGSGPWSARSGPSPAPVRRVSLAST